MNCQSPESGIYETVENMTTPCLGASGYHGKTLDCSYTAAGDNKFEDDTREQYRRCRAPSPEDELAASQVKIKYTISIRLHKLTQTQRRYRAQNAVSAEAQHALQLLDEDVLVRINIDFTEEKRTNELLKWRISGFLEDGINLDIIQTLAVCDVDATIAEIIKYINDIAEKGIALSWPAWKAQETKDLLASGGIEQDVGCTQSLSSSQWH